METDMQISRHFTLAEAEASDTAERLEIVNTVPGPLVAMVSATADNILEPVRENFDVPFSPTSFYRCEALERVITRKAYEGWALKHDMPIGDDSWAMYFQNKQHPTGRAVDFRVPGVPLIDVARWIRSEVEFDQLILEYYRPARGRGWIHASFNIGANREQVLTMGPGGVVSGLP